MTYVLRRYLRSIGERLLTPRDLREYIVRLVLGTVFGVAIGTYTSASGNASEQVIANPVSSVGAPALAFLAGYGVEAVFRMLDGLAEQVLLRKEVKRCHASSTTGGSLFRCWALSRRKKKPPIGVCLWVKRKLTEL